MCLPMGVSCTPDIFQEKMLDLMSGLEFTRMYLDDLLCLSMGSFEDHLEKLEVILRCLQKVGLKCNASKSAFCATQIEYLGYWLTRDGIKPLPNKVEAILNLALPTKLKELHRVLGIVQFYRDIWEKWSHVLAPLTDLVCELSSSKHKCSKKVIWTDIHKKASDEKKKIIAHDIILAYPN